MATPEEASSHIELFRPGLSVVAGGLSAKETVELRPIPVGGTLEEFQGTLNGLIRGGDYANKPTEELIEIRGDVSSVREALSERWAKLAAEMDIVQRAMTWTNGYSRDLSKEIDSRPQ